MRKLKPEVRSAQKLTRLRNISEEQTLEKRFLGLTTLFVQFDLKYVIDNYHLAGLPSDPGPRLDKRVYKSSRMQSGIPEGATCYYLGPETYKTGPDKKMGRVTLPSEEEFVHMPIAFFGEENE